MSLCPDHPSRVHSDRGHPSIQPVTAVLACILGTTGWRWPCLSTAHGAAKQQQHQCRSCSVCASCLRKILWFTETCGLCRWQEGGGSALLSGVASLWPPIPSVEEVKRAWYQAAVTPFEPRIPVSARHCYLGLSVRESLLQMKL